MFKKMKKIIILLLAICVLCHISFGQKVKAELKISSSKRSACVGEPLEFTVLVINHSEKPIVIDANGIGYRTNLWWYVDKARGSEGGSSTSVADVAAGYVPKFILIQPKESYVDNKTFRLNYGLFRADRKYSLSFSYGYFGKSLYNEIPVLRGVIDSNEAPMAFVACPKENSQPK